MNPQEEEDQFKKEMDAALVELEAFVKRLGQERAGVVIAALLHKHPKVANYGLAVSLNRIVPQLEELEDRARTCQCENCRAKRGQT